MASRHPEETDAAASRSPAPWFVTTHWSAVLEAGQSGAPAAKSALDRLCKSYWFPLYAYIRRQGFAPHDAEDLTQGFFLWLLEGNHLRVADPERGRFR